MAPDVSTSIGSFDLVMSHEAQYGIKMAKYRSRETGLVVMHVDIGQISAGLIHGYFIVATEANDDSGLPHTLEHAVFMGSERYPHKGVLDKIANLSLAQGTNAWTASDSTVYTVTCAGMDGFLNLLPAYLDHILYPSITDACVTTEVHAINEKGDDIGVVYSEMQGCEKTSESICDLAFSRLMYENSGYSKETGGLMADIRTLTAQRIRNYHSANYRPDNLSLVVCGHADTTELLHTLQAFDEHIVSKGPLPPMAHKPWSDPVPPLTETKVADVKFPDADDASSCTVFLGWRGPEYSDFQAIEDFELLLRYLTDGAVSPVERALVQSDAPHCGSLSTRFMLYKSTCFTVIFEGVTCDKIADFPEAFFRVVRSIVDDPSTFDVKRMREVIAREKSKQLNMIENSPNEYFSYIAVADALYSDDKRPETQFSAVCAVIERLTFAATYDEDVWIKLLLSLLDSPHVCVRASPSTQLAETTATEEEARLEEQRERLGVDGLQQMGAILEAAQEQNAADIPSHILEDVSVPSFHNIFFIPVSSRYIGTLSSIQTVSPLIDIPIGDMDDAKFDFPFGVSLQHVPSAFVTVKVLINSAHLSESDRFLLELYLDVVFETCVRRDGVLIAHDDVVQQLQSDTVSFSNGVGVFSGGENFSVGTHSEFIQFRIHATADRFAVAVRWIREILWATEFPSERLLVACKRLLSDVPALKRDGWPMSRALLNQLDFPSTSCNSTASNVIRQERYLAALVTEMGSPEGATAVETRITKMRQRLCIPEALTLLISGDISLLEAPLDTLAREFVIPDYIKNSRGDQGPIEHRFIQHYLSPMRNKAAILGIPGVESEFVRLTVPGPTSFTDPDLPALLVLVEYLTLLEGLFWIRIRGAGLAYGCFLKANVESGLIGFSLYRASDALKAFSEAKTIIKELLQSETFDETEVMAAKSGLVFSVIASRSNMNSATYGVFVQDVIRQTPTLTPNDRLAKIHDVTTDDLVRVLRRWIQPIFSPAVGNLAITTSPSKVTSLQEGFQNLGYQVVNVTSPEDFFHNTN